MGKGKGGSPLRQNKGVKTEGMGVGSNSGLPMPKKPGSGIGTVKFEGTIVKTDNVSGVTKPSPEHAGSHDGRRTRLHGDD